MNLEVLKRAQDYIEKMANGINPITGDTISDTDTLNDAKIIRCLFYVNDILKECVVKETKKVKRNSVPFNLTQEQIAMVELYDNPVSISRIVQRINEVLETDEVKKLKVSEICDWLISLGFLEKVEYKGIMYKRPTELGNKMGMYVEHQVTPFREYDIVLYKNEMQKFIMDNFENLLEFLQNNK